jgi:protein-ribulosamine 3-kinase
LTAAQKHRLFLNPLENNWRRCTKPTFETFGWEHDNYMGSVPQQNTPDPDWTSFFIHRRLEPLVQQCLSKGLLTAKEHGLFEKLYERLPQLFDDGEKPALLHGDLWSGNYLCSHEASRC